MRDHPCQEYGSMNMRHDWGAWTETEERGVLIVTHGPRTGRIYNVEQFSLERACAKCQDCDADCPCWCHDE